MSDQQHEAEIQEYREAAIHGALAYQARIEKLKAEVERLRGALADLIASGENYIEYHKRKLYSDSGPSNVVGLTPALEKAKKALAGEEA